VHSYALSRDEGYSFQFARGWIDSLQIYNLCSPVARACLHSPWLRIPRRLVIGASDYDDPGFEVLRAAPFFGNARTFQSGGCDGRGHYGGEHARALFRKMTRVEDLHLYALGVDTQTLFALPLPHLRVLEVDHLREYPLDVLAANPTLKS